TGVAGKRSGFQGSGSQISVNSRANRRIYAGGARSETECRSSIGRRRFQAIAARAEQRSNSGGGWILYFASRRDCRGASTQHRRSETENRGGDQEFSSPRADVNERRRN